MGYARLSSLALATALLLPGALFALPATAEEDVQQQVLAAGESGVTQARQYVKFVGNKALSIARDETLNTDEKKQQIADLFDDSIDIEKLSRLVLGRHWRKASDDQQARYKTLYRDFLLKYYAAKFVNYTGEGFEITKIFDEGDGRFRVNTVIAESDTTPEVRVNYRLKKNRDTGLFLIYDIIVEGISLLTTQRSEFGAVVSRNGMDHLLNELQSRIDKLDAGEDASSVAKG